MKSYIVCGIKLICYSGQEDAAEVTCNMCSLMVILTNQFSQNFVFSAKIKANFFYVFIVHKKHFLQKFRLLIWRSRRSLDPPSFKYFCLDQEE